MQPIKELTLYRTYTAPIEMIWDAWTQPELIKQWWGPDYVSIPECDVDLRVGGTIHIVMKAGPEMGPYAGILWPMTGTFTAVELNALISYHAQAWTEGAREATEIDQVTEISFSSDNGATKLHIHAAILKTGPDADMAVQGMEMGFNQQLAKFDRFLANK